MLASSSVGSGGFGTPAGGPPRRARPASQPASTGAAAARLGSSPLH